MITDGKISRLRIHTDSLAAIDFTPCEAELVGLLFDKDILTSRVEEFVKNLEK